MSLWISWSGLVVFWTTSLKGKCLSLPNWHEAQNSIFLFKLKGKLQYERIWDKILREGWPNRACQMWAWESEAVKAFDLLKVEKRLGCEIALAGRTGLNEQVGFDCLSRGVRSCNL